MPEFGLGLTDLVKRASDRADQVAHRDAQQSRGRKKILPLLLQGLCGWRKGDGWRLPPHRVFRQLTCRRPLRS